MKLSDVVGAADLAIFAEVALVLFFCAFAAVLVRACWPGTDASWHKLGHLPLEGEHPTRVDQERNAQ